MFGARLGVRVLGGGVCACTSASILYNQLINAQENTIQSTHALSVETTDNGVKSHGDVMNTNSVLSKVQTLGTALAVKPLNCRFRSDEKGEQYSDYDMESKSVHKIASSSESSEINNLGSGLEHVLQERVNVEKSGVPSEFQPFLSLSHFHAGPLGPEKFVFNTDVNEEILSPGFEDENNLTSDQYTTYDAAEEFRVYDAEVRNSDPGKPSEKLRAAINVARDRCWCKMYESGSPGMAISISVNGKTVWSHGFGYADLENRLLVGTGCIMRIASISKPITMTVLAKLIEQKKVDLDSSVSKYVPDWPTKTVDGEQVDITVRQLCSHLSGIRHYERKGEEGKESDEFELKEYLLNKKFKTTEEALQLFKNDELMHRPGSKFLYTTHGWTLIAAIIENVTKEPFDKYMKKQFKVLGLNYTYLDEAEPLIYNRAKYYVRDDQHRLRNAPTVDNSYKWAGGGFLSNVNDLTRFGNAMLYSYQKREGKNQPQEKSQNIPTQIKSSSDESRTASSTEKCSENKTADSSQISSTKSDGKSVVAADNLVHPEKIVQSVIIQQSENEQLESNLRIDLSHEDIINDEITVEEIEDKVSVVEVEEISKKTEKVVFQPGPYSTVNKTSPLTDKYLPGYLKHETMAELWKPIPEAGITWGGEQMFYGLGWAISPREKKHGFCKNQKMYITHTGGAIGASSVLLIAPQSSQGEPDCALPKGVVVAIICNMQSVGLSKLAVEVAREFEGISAEKPVKVEKVYQC